MAPVSAASSSSATAHPTDDPSGPQETTTNNGYTYNTFENPITKNPSTLEEENIPNNPPNGVSNGTSAAVGSSSNRILAPDLLRGLLMILMAMDHLALALNTWSHGTNIIGENDSVPFDEWNYTVAYIVRTCTHLCASGFTFLLGMGVVYLGRSRTRSGWGWKRLARYFALRMFILIAVMEIRGWILTVGSAWFFNMSLFALAVNYFLAGLLWLLMERTEAVVATWIDRILPEGESNVDGSADPLLEVSAPSNSSTTNKMSKSLSWHVHNLILVVLSSITIFWNVWMSPTHGHCISTNVVSQIPFPSLPPDEPFFTTLRNIFVYTVFTQHFLSGFPPLGWLSFALCGLLYGRILTAQRWSPRMVLLGHLSASLLFFFIFSLTRLLRFGNLSEDCIQTPNHDPSSNANPYLVDAKSFFYIVKYPPDVAFWSFTNSVNLLLLGLFGAIPTAAAVRLTVLLDFGTSALFFYVVHVFVVFAVGAVAVPLLGWDVGRPAVMDPSSSLGIDSFIGYTGILVLCMGIMWPFCRLWSRFKSTKPASSIWRFF